VASPYNIVVHSPVFPEEEELGPKLPGWQAGDSQ